MAPNQEGEYPMIAAAQTGPGPGSYALPPLVGPNTAPNKQSAPQWTVKLPLKTKYNDAPAPSYVPADNKVPTATVKGRNFYNPKKLITPAPNYKNESFKHPGAENAPAYSMGQRTRHRKADQVPPSTRYTLPSLVGGRNNVSRSEPVWQMSFIKPEHTSYSYDATKGPGPAAYSVGEHTDSVRKRQPTYSLGARYQTPKDKTQKPGPGQYNPMYATKKKAPSFSMGTRHSQFVLPMLTAADLHHF